MFLAWVAGSGLGMEPLTQAFTPLSTKTSPRSHNIAVLQYTNRLVTPLFQFHKWDVCFVLSETKGITFGCMYILKRPFINKAQFPLARSHPGRVSITHIPVAVHQVCWK